MLPTCSLSQHRGAPLHSADIETRCFPSLAGGRQRYRWASLDPRDMASLLLTFGRVRDESPGKVGGMREGANHEFVQVYPKRAHTHIHAHTHARQKT